MSGPGAGDTGGIGPEAVELDQEAFDDRLARVEDGVAEIEGKLGEALGRVEELLAAEEQMHQLRRLVRAVVPMLVEGLGSEDTAAVIRWALHPDDDDRFRAALWLAKGPEDKADQDVVDQVVQAARDAGL